MSTATATTATPTAPTTTTRVAPAPTPLPAVQAYVAASPMVAPDPTPRVFGCTRLCAVEFGGADTTGAQVANAGIQKAIDSLPAAGGEVHVPAGQYLIDTLSPIRLRSNMWLHLDDNAIFVAKPNDQIRYTMIMISGVNEVLVSGGTLKGDRDKHTYTPQKVASQSTHEWGMGIRIGGAERITVRDITIQDFTGDGLDTYGANVDNKPGIELSQDLEFINVISTNNRRQGMSVLQAKNVTIINCELAHTNGTLPECGIDIEPENGGASNNIRIFNSHLHSNKANGYLALQRQDVDSPVSGLLITGSVIENNGACGVYLGKVDNIDIFNNRIVNNGQSGIHIPAPATNVHISENTMGMNYNRGTLQADAKRKDFTQVGLSKAIEADIYNKAPAEQVTVGRNYYI